MGPKTLPCSIPEVIFANSEHTPLITTLCLLLNNKYVIYVINKYIKDFIFLNYRLWQCYKIH